MRAASVARRAHPRPPAASQRPPPTPGRLGLAYAVWHIASC